MVSVVSTAGPRPAEPDPAAANEELDRIGVASDEEGVTLLAGAGADVDAELCAEARVKSEEAAQMADLTRLLLVSSLIFVS